HIARGEAAGPPPETPSAQDTGATVRGFGGPPLRRSEMLAAPLRWVRPSRLDQPLVLPRGRVAQAMRALGVHTVGELLEHLPADSRQSRSVAALRAGEPATGAVEVRSLRSRPVRRSG